MQTPEPPEFQFNMPLTKRKVYRSEEPDRKTETAAWAAAVILAASSVYIIYRTGSLGWLQALFLFLFTGAAAAVSLAGWLDRRTSITVSENLILYESPLRSCSILWNAVDTIRLLPIGPGFRVYIQADRQHFNFRTGEPALSDRPRQAYAIIDGLELAGRLLQGTGLTDPTWEQGFWEYRRVDDDHTQS